LERNRPRSTEEGEGSRVLEGPRKAAQGEIKAGRAGVSSTDGRPPAAFELRNKYWLNADLANILRENSVALALIDKSWVPRPWEMKESFDLITSDFTYIRWLGDRKGIEQKTKTWNKIIVDRKPELEEWAKIVRKMHQRKINVFVFANNHYAGYGPATVEMFRSTLRPTRSHTLDRDAV
jgi:uncharacterized protein YecE (DUF72 family)